MPIKTFIGYQGSGKNISVVEQLLVDYRKGMKIYSNFELNGIPYEKLDLNVFRDYLSGDKQLKNVSIAMDELQLFADSREHRNDRNKILSYFALQTRKRNVKLYLITQYFENIDKRLRRCAMDDMIIKCEGVYHSTKKVMLNGEEKPLLIAVRQIILYKGEIIKRIIGSPERFFDYYKTGEVKEIG